MENISLEAFETNCLLGMFPCEMAEKLPNIKPYKFLSVFKNFSTGVFSFDKLTTLSLAEREALKTSFFSSSMEILEKLQDPNGTEKISLKLFDGNIIEAVLLVDKANRKTACISSQVGCPLRCKFCKTGLLGFSRNLTTAEIVEQFFLLEKLHGAIDNIVFMGMGEPLLNFDAVKKAILIFTSKEGRNFSHRRITISTSGVISGIERLVKELSEIRLAVSLTTANEALRKNLMPVTEANPLSRLKEVLKTYAAKSKRRVTLELALMHNVNTSEHFCREVIDFAKDLNAHVNLIPWNPIPELDFLPPTQSEISFFQNTLKSANINVTRRAKNGSNISGACGQLGKVVSRG